MDIKKLHQKLNELSDPEKISIIDYTILGMQGDGESKDILKKLFGEIDISSVGDYYIIQRETYKSMGSSAKKHVDSETKKALEYTPPLQLNSKKVFNMLAVLRINAGLTQKELADKSGVNIRQIQRYESASSDIKNMTLKNAILIADALNCDVQDFIKEG